MTSLTPLQHAWLRELGIPRAWLRPAPTAPAPAPAAPEAAPAHSRVSSGTDGHPDANSRSGRLRPRPELREQKGARPSRDTTSKHSEPVEEAASPRLTPPAIPTEQPTAAPPETAPDLATLQSTVQALIAREPRLAAAHPVPGHGVAHHPQYLIIGEQPSLDDELAGQPFQGASGRLLTAMLGAAGLPKIESTYQTYVLKARLETGQTPDAELLAPFLPALRREIQLLRPQWILALGDIALNTILELSSAPPDAAAKVGDVAADPWGRPHPVDLGWGPVTLWATHAPASLLVRAGDKPRAWRDLVAFAQAVLSAAPSRDPSDRSACPDPGSPGD